MRFFSHEWAALDDKASARVVADYDRFISNFRGQAAERIRDFKLAFDLRGALLDKIEVRSASKEVDLFLVAGDRQAGYCLVKLAYGGAALATSPERTTSAFLSRAARIRYDEFDTAASFVHRFLLWPKDLGELEITFTGVEVLSMTLAERNYVTYGETAELS